MNTHSTLNMMPHPLDRYTEAVRGDQPAASQSDHAQRRLMARIEEARQLKPTRAMAWRWATAAVLAILMVPVLVMMPGSNGSIAFADVQSYFTSFQTMKARMTTQMNGNTMLAMDILVDDQDRVRLDAGDAFSYIIDPNQRVMLQLFHQRQQAFEVPLENDASDAPADSLDWLEQIREYQGHSRLVDEVRTVNGMEVVGFHMTDQAVDMTLWATEQGRPVLLEMHMGHEAAAVTTQIEFSFDQPVDPERFSLTVPEGYAVSKSTSEG